MSIMDGIADLMRPLPTPAKVEPRGEMKRFTFDVDAGLHRRIKVRCAKDGVQIADRLRAILEREFPPEGGEDDGS